MRWQPRFLRAQGDRQGVLEGGSVVQEREERWTCASAGGDGSGREDVGGVAQTFPKGASATCGDRATLSFSRVPHSIFFSVRDSSKRRR